MSSLTNHVRELVRLWWVRIESFVWTKLGGDAGLYLITVLVRYIVPHYFRNFIYTVLFYI